MPNQDESELKELLRRRVRTLGAYANGFVRQADEAERLFAERAYSPFWDILERVGEMLGWLTDVAREIEDVQLALDGSPWSWRNEGAFDSRMIMGITLTGGTPIAAPTSLARPSARVADLELPDLSAAAARFDAVRNLAHRDFQFAQIYETRRVTQAVLSSQVKSAEALRTTLLVLDRISQAGRHVALTVVGMSEMLDNIQRRRFPSTTDQEDADY